MVNISLTKTNKDDAQELEAVKFKGHYISAIGKRKSAVATVRLYKKGNGIILINDKKANTYFSEEKKYGALRQLLKLIGANNEYNISILVRGGGVSSQIDAIKHALSKAFIKVDEVLKPILRSKNFLTRDSRIKERKKPGLKKARRAPQWAKR